MEASQNGELDWHSHVKRSRGRPRGNWRRVKKTSTSEVEGHGQKRRNWHGIGTDGKDLLVAYILSKRECGYDDCDG